MAPTNKNKRLRDNDQDLDTDSDNERFYNSCNNWPRFLVMDSSSDDLPLSKLSPFAVQKGFQVVAGTLKSIKRLRDGSFLVECTRKSQAMGLLKTTRFVERPVRVSIHKALNSSIGDICCHEMSGMTEMEIRMALQEQGVVEVHRVMVKKDTEKVPTSTLFLTFNTPDLLKEITVGYLKWMWPCLFPTLCVVSTATSLATQANVARLLWSERVVEKISMKVSVRDPSCALIAMVPTLHRLKIARSGRRRRRLNVSALRNAYPFRKPDSWLKPRCWLWSMEVRPTLLPLPPEESPNLFSVKPR